MSRRIDIIRNDYSRSYNKDYNDKIQSIADYLFQTQRADPAGYKSIGGIEKEQNQFAAARDMQNTVDTISNPEYFDPSWSSLSEYEQIIASHLLYGNYYTYVFSGGMGTGKTTTANHILDFIANHTRSENSAFIKISFDFNLGILDTPEVLIDRFANELYNKLTFAIKDYIKTRKRGVNVVLDFLKYLVSINFDGFIEYDGLQAKVNTVPFLEYSNDKRADILIEFIKDKKDLITRIQMLIKFLGFIKTSNGQNDFVIIFYDNIDILSPDIQIRIFMNYILQLNSISKTKCLISMRRTTLFRNIDVNDTVNAQSFGFIHHYGHKVSDLAIERLNYFKNGADADGVISKLSPRYREALKRRIEYLYSELTASSKGPHSLADFINALAGNSLRLGLFMCIRLIMNNIVEFDKSPKQRDRYKKALIVSHFDNMLLSDQFEVFNLFKTEEDFSLLPLKILQIVAQNEPRNRHYKIQDFETNEAFINYTSKDGIREVLSFMLSSRRPLCYSNKFHDGQRLNPDSSLFLTEIGYGYFNRLASDLTYLQECFAVVGWNSDIIPEQLDTQNELERLSLVIKCLRVAFDEELDNFDNLIFGGVKVNHIVIRIVEQVYDTILRLNMNTANYKVIFDLLEQHSSHILFSRGANSKELEQILETIKRLPGR